MDWKKPILFGIDRSTCSSLVLKALFAHEVDSLTIVRPCQAFYMERNAPIEMLVF